MAVREGILNLYGTSTEEIEARTRNLYLSKIEALTAENQQQASHIHELSTSNNELSSQIDYLKSLLNKHNIAFKLEP